METMTEPRWLTPSENTAWLQLVTMMIVLPGSLDSQLERDEDLNMVEYMVLAMLSDAPDRERRMSQIAALINISPSRLSRIAGRLEKKGLITRTMAQDDRRAVLARLTDDGFAKLVQAAPGHVAEVRERIFDRLSAEQVAQLTAIGHTLFGSDCSPS